MAKIGNASLLETHNREAFLIQHRIKEIIKNLEQTYAKFNFNELTSIKRLFEAWSEEVINWSKKSQENDIDNFQRLINKSAEVSAVILNASAEQKQDALDSLAIIVKELLKVFPIPDDVPNSIDSLLEFEKEVLEKIEKREAMLIEQEEALGKLFDELALKTSMYEKRHEETINKIEQSNETILDGFKKTCLNIKDDFEREASEKVESLNQLAEQGKVLTHFISGRALSGFFEDRATEEKKSAFKWTVGTWIFAGAALTSLIVTFIYQLNNLQEQTINYSFLTTKVLFIASLGFIAKWTAKRANKHISEEAKYHRLAVNTHTIDNFISKLKPETQEEVTKAVALKIFTEYESNVTPIEFETPNVVDAVKGFLQK